MSTESQKKSPAYKLGHKEGYLEAMKACGNCHHCFGKGYSTQMVAHGSNGNRLQVNLCVCPRAKQLEKIFDERLEKQL